MINTSRKNDKFVISNPIESEIARSSISGMSEFIGFGERNVVTPLVGGHDVWLGVSATIPIPNQLGGEQMMVTSTNHDDRLNGTNVQKVELDYLDVRGIEQYETINMNGTAWVRTVGTNIRFINAIHSIQVGSGTTAIGNVSVCANGTLTTVYNIISSGGNMSLSAHRMVPANKNFYLHTWNASSVSQESSGIARIRIRATTMHGTRINNVFLFSDSATLHNSTYVKDFHIPKKIPALSIIKCSVDCIGTVYCDASFSGELDTN